MLIDIVILPPENLRRKIGAKMKKEMGSLPNYFIVDNIKLIPHLSLWHIETSKERINDIAQELKQITKKQGPVKINSLKFHALDKFKGCVDFSVKNNNDLNSLREKVFKKVYPYKTGMMPKFASFLGPYTRKQLKEVKKYGRTLGFAPHFTMGWLKKEKDTASVVKKMQKVKFSFLAKEIYICEVDSWWQVKKIIKKIDFNK